MPLTLHENWYHDDQILDLLEKVKLAKENIPNGFFIEIGCWEGKSTVAIANEIFPRYLDCVDNWKGNGEYYESGITDILKTRDVYSVFEDNIKNNTRGNYFIFRMDQIEYLKKLSELISQSVSFIHLDGPHDYDSVKTSLDLILPLMIPGGIICGDDFINSNSKREDLNGGVEKAVRDTWPDFEHDTSVRSLNFWYKEIK